MNRRKWVRGKNRRAESNIVTAYLQNIEVSYSHLYQEMQQAVYDSETFARVDSDSDIYTYNRSIMAVKEYFQQLGISYGTDLSLKYGTFGCEQCSAKNVGRFT